MKTSLLQEKETMFLFKKDKNKTRKNGKDFMSILILQSASAII